MNCIGNPARPYDGLAETNSPIYLIERDRDLLMEREAACKRLPQNTLRRWEKAMLKTVAMLKSPAILLSAAIILKLVAAGFLIKAACSRIRSA